jgi:hypothetical protein
MIVNNQHYRTRHIAILKMEPQGSLGLETTPFFVTASIQRNEKKNQAEFTGYMNGFTLDLQLQ